MRSRVLVGILVSILAGSQARAQGLLPSEKQGPHQQAPGILSPGKPAGVREAARRSPRGLVMIGAATVAVAAVGIAVAQSNDTKCGSACEPTTPSTTN